MDRPLHILVTGAAGYIGSTLVRELLLQGHSVVAVDSMIFGDRPLADLMSHPRLRIRRMDTRSLRREHLTGMQAIVDLAGLSSDLAADLDPTWTDVASHRTQVRLAQLARSCGIKRYILISSCTVYGNAPEADCTEESATAPLTRHAHSCLQAEEAILPLASSDFAPTSLRLGLVYGRSARIRFDLMVNAMALSALRLQRITLDNGGHRVRGHLHVKDVVHGIQQALQAPCTAVTRQVFNISHLNTSAADIASCIRDTLGNHVQICPHGGAPDPHHNKPNHLKAAQALAFRPSVSLSEGINELLDAIDRGSTTDTPETHATRWVQEVLAQGREARAAFDHAITSPRTPFRTHWSPGFGGSTSGLRIH